MHELTSLVYTSVEPSCLLSHSPLSSSLPCSFRKVLTNLVPMHSIHLNAYIKEHVPAMWEKKTHVKTNNCHLLLVSVAQWIHDYDNSLVCKAWNIVRGCSGLPSKNVSQGLILNFFILLFFILLFFLRRQGFSVSLAVLELIL